MKKSWMAGVSGEFLTPDANEIVVVRKQWMRLAGDPAPTHGTSRLLGLRTELR